MLSLGEPSSLYWLGSWHDPIRRTCAVGPGSRISNHLIQKVRDLTHRLGPETPVWSGFGQAKMSPAADPTAHEPNTIAKDGFRATYYEMVGQYGTHVDPPAHFAENGATMDQIPLEQMILPLIVFSSTPLLTKDPNHAFSVDNIKDWERELRARSRRIIRCLAHRNVEGLRTRP